jgi:hypothetical protein
MRKSVTVIDNMEHHGQHIDAATAGAEGYGGNLVVDVEHQHGHAGDGAGGTCSHQRRSTGTTACFTAPLAH